MGSNEFAVFTEFSPASREMQAGWNTRVFTDRDSYHGDGMRCDLGATGVITLAPGTYHITGFSTVCYFNAGEPPEMATVRVPASAGYCRVRKWDPAASTDTSSLRGLPNEDPSVICVGSGSTANQVPSLFEAYLTVQEEVKILLEHQSGSNPEHIYLRVYTQDSRWHAMARIAIRRL